jgi:hypothetical protein
MSLSQAKDRVLKSIGIAEKTELQLYERLCDVGRDFVLLKEEIAAAGFNIKPWVRENLPRSYSWLESHVRLFREWDKFLECLEWAREVQYPKNERPSLLTAYDLMDDYDRNEVRLRGKTSVRYRKNRVRPSSSGPWRSSRAERLPSRRPPQ